LKLPREIGAADYEQLKGIGRVTLDCVIPEDFTTTNRADLFAFLSNALSNAAMASVFEDLDPIY
jgi:hypothetical protein